MRDNNLPECVINIPGLGLVFQVKLSIIIQVIKQQLSLKILVFNPSITSKEKSCDGCFTRSRNNDSATGFTTFTHRMRKVNHASKDVPEAHVSVSDGNRRLHKVNMNGRFTGYGVAPRVSLSAKRWCEKCEKRNNRFKTKTCPTLSRKNDRRKCDCVVKSTKEITPFPIYDQMAITHFLDKMRRRNVFLPNNEFIQMIRVIINYKTQRSLLGKSNSVKTGELSDRTMVVKIFPTDPASLTTKDGVNFHTEREIHTI